MLEVHVPSHVPRRRACTYRTLKYRVYVSTYRLPWYRPETLPDSRPRAIPLSFGYFYREVKSVTHILKNAADRRDRRVRRHALGPGTRPCSQVSTLIPCRHKPGTVSVWMSFSLHHGARGTDARAQSAHDHLRRRMIHDPHETCHRALCTAATREPRAGPCR